MPPREFHARGRVLLTDASERSMLAACRGVHRRGYEVTGAAFGRFAAVHWSRACSRRVRVTDPRTDVQRFIADLRVEFKRQPKAILLPGSDFSLLAVSRWREQLKGLAQTGLPSRAVVQRCFDREVLADAASAAGLTPAAQQRCIDADDALAAAREFGYPVVLKSICTVGEPSDVVRAGRDTCVVSSDQELESALEPEGEPFLVQRAESGRTVSFGGVVAGGRLLGTAVSTYERTWPPNAGSASASVTIIPPEGLEDSVTTLLGHLGWEGMFELELIERADRRLVPIDLNPRAYGSMALAAAAGANLAGIWCDWLSGLDPSPVLARPGCRYRWEDADLRHLLWQAKRHNYRAAARALRPRRRVTHPYFEARDPLPIVARAVWFADRKLQ